MITLKDAINTLIYKEGLLNEYAINTIVYCTADRNRDKGGQRITLKSARLGGKPVKKQSAISAAVSEKVSEKEYRKGTNWLNFYDQQTRTFHKVHLDLIEEINNIQLL
jgi:hypothetical protein